MARFLGDQNILTIVAIRDRLQNKDISIETLRGVAIILVVMTHVIGTNGTGLDTPNGSLLQWFHLLTNNYRMPLFAVISGYLYAFRPVQTNAASMFLAGKLRRFLPPLLSVSTLQFLVICFTPGTHAKPVLADIWKIYVLPYDQFWFLQAIMLIFLAIPLFERFGLMDSFWKWAGCLISTYLIPCLIPISCSVFSINGFAYLLSCFILGIGIYRFRSFFSGSRVLVSSGILFGIAVLMQQLTYFGMFDIPFDRTRGIGLGFGLIGAVFVFSIRQPITSLAWIGSYAFEIYLFHRFGQAGSRIFLKSAGITNIAILFVVGTIAGLILPILITRFLSQSASTRRLFLGHK